MGAAVLWDNGVMSGAEQRAAERRRSWTGRVVVTGEPKERPTRISPLSERLAAFSALNRRVWTSLGFDWNRGGSRSNMPGEILDLFRERQ